MRDTKFYELVDLYLDGELSGQEFRKLQREILKNPYLRRQFDECCRLRYAERAALNPHSSGFYARELAAMRLAMLTTPRRFSWPNGWRVAGPRRVRLFGSTLAATAAVIALVIGFGFLEEGAPGTGTLDVRTIQHGVAQVTDRDIPRMISASGREAVTPAVESISARLREQSFASSLHVGGMSSSDVESEVAAERVSPMVSAGLSPSFAEAFSRLVREENLRRDHPESHRLILVVPGDSIPERDLIDRRLERRVRHSRPGSTSVDLDPFASPATPLAVPAAALPQR